MTDALKAQRAAKFLMEQGQQWNNVTADWPHAKKEGKWVSYVTLSYKDDSYVHEIYATHAQIIKDAERLGWKDGPEEHGSR